MNLVANQIKYGPIKVVNFTIDQWLEKNATEMFLIHNERTSVAANLFIRTLKNKIHKYMTSI